VGIELPFLVRSGPNMPQLIFFASKKMAAFIRGGRRPHSLCEGANPTPFFSNFSPASSEMN
jgi:hypothetical protein